MSHCLSPGPAMDWHYCLSEREAFPVPISTEAEFAFMSAYPDQAKICLLFTQKTDQVKE